MSEDWDHRAASGPAAAEAAGAAATAGAMLRQAREAAGLHVAALAVGLKVPVRKLEALEADRHDLLTDAVFVRALASSICRTLKLDPQPVLDRLPRMAAPRLIGAGRSINEPFRAPSDGAPPTWLDQLSRPVFLAVFALLLGALILILLPTAQVVDAAAPAAKPVAVLPTSVAPVPLSTSVPAAADTAVMSPAMAPVAAASMAAPASPAAAATPQPAAAKAVAEAPAAAASGVIVFRAKADSWVEVIDAKDVVAVRKVLEAGESAAASGALPLRVTIGRVDATQVQVRGKPFDLLSVSRDNIARFEVK